MGGLRAAAAQAPGPAAASTSISATAAMARGVLRFTLRFQGLGGGRVAWRSSAASQPRSFASALLSRWESTRGMPRARHCWR